ncbi:MED10B [Scenedesmus sp. PABB004]|nr:MED10B [Scenedesmus sp. PABB004]
MAVSKAAEQAALKSLQDLLRQLYELEAGLGDFTAPNSQELLAARLQEFLDGVQAFKAAAGAYSGTQVPTALCRFVDAGGHPDDFVRLAFRSAVADSQLAAGRVAAMQALREELLAQTAAAFPEAAAAYDEVVQAKQAQAQEPGKAAGG